MNRTAAFLCIAILVSISGCSGAGTATVPQGSEAVTQSSTTSNGTSSLKCFSGNGGTCTITNSNGTLVATLDNTAAGSYAGVYFSNRNNLKGTALSSLTALSFTLRSPSNTQPNAGSPRISIPVSNNGSSTTAYVYAQDCSFSTPVTYPETVNAFSDSSCKEMQGYQSPQQYYASWNTFVTQFSGAIISGTPYFLADADQPGKWMISNIQISP